jgi:glycosyltransferase involved in cell wall biosynthesis
VEDGKNGYMIPVKDAELLADRMLTLTKDRALLLSMSDAAYETCKTRFEVGIINDQMRRALGY